MHGLNFYFYSSFASRSKTCLNEKLWKSIAYAAREGCRYIQTWTNIAYPLFGCASFRFVLQFQLVNRSLTFIVHWSLKFELAIGSPHTVPPNITLLGAKMNWSSTRPNRPCGWRIVRGIFRNLIPHTVTSLGTSPLHCWVQKQCLHSLRLTWGLLKVTFVIFASHCATSLRPYRLKAMTHIDDSLAVPTSENFGVNVSTDDRPIWTEDSESLIDVDRMDFFFIF